ncbi:MAG: hypothetical protein WC775_02135 [Patescibacteria group bacterium]|jgi:hypothetical protein
MSPNRSNKKLLFFLIFATIVLGVTNVYLFVDRYVTAKNEAVRKENERKAILEGMSAVPTQVTVDLSKKTVTGSPLIFGGSSFPDQLHTGVMDKLKAVGVTNIRKDFFLEYTSPAGITLDSYRRNDNNIQDIANWRTKDIGWANTNFVSAKSRGMKMMGIVTYAPKWLTHSGNEHGVPKDWGVYEDIVKKLYKHYRDNLDYLEMWNEPTYKYFLDPAGSGLTREEAYLQIFLHASKAIREVDSEINDGKKIPVGGFVAHTPTETGLLEYLMQNEEFRKSINFISYHNYEHVPEPSWTAYKTILAKYGMQNLPVFLTEWNYSPGFKEYNSKLVGDEAVTYTGDKLTSFLNMGLAGANYFALIAEDAKFTTPWSGYLAFYKWENGKATLLPQAKTWRLMSVSLALGKGKSQVYETSYKDKEINAAGFTNVKGQKGTVLVNKGTTGKLVNVSFKNLGAPKHVIIEEFIADPDHDGGTAVRKEYVDEPGEALNFTMYVPAQSVVGVLLSDTSKMQEILKLFFK